MAQEGLPEDQSPGAREKAEIFFAATLTCAPIIMPGARGIRGRNPIVETTGARHRMNRFGDYRARPYAVHDQRQGRGDQWFFRVSQR